MKHARFGMKLYELTTTDDRTLDFIVYCGNGMFYNDDQYINMPSTERIPSVLMDPYLGKGLIFPVKSNIYVAQYEKIENIYRKN